MKKKTVIVREEYERFDGYNQLLADVIEKHLMRTPGDPYKNAMAFLFAMENSKASIISSLELSGIVKGKNAVGEINELCVDFGRKRQGVLAKNTKLKSDIKNLSLDQLKTRMAKRETMDNTMYR